MPAPLHQQPQKQQFIHVTKDSDTFHSLQVTGMHDPRLIKNTILRKLALEGKCERYLFFHENGNKSGKNDYKDVLKSGIKLNILLRYCFNGY